MQIKKPYFILAIAIVLVVCSLPVTIGGLHAASDVGTDTSVIGHSSPILHKRCHTNKKPEQSHPATPPPPSDSLIRPKKPRICKVKITTVDLFSAKVAAAIHAKLDAVLSGDFVASLEETFDAEIDVQVKTLGGMIDRENLNLQLVKKQFITALKSKFEAKFEAAIKVEFDAELKIQLVKEISGASKDCLAKKTLYKIIVAILADFRAELEIRLPRVAAGLKSYIGNELATHIKGLSVDIPWLLHLDVASSFDLDLDLKLAASAAIKAYAELDVKALAGTILENAIQ
ncbi:hypothetical protein BX666DRAFT_1997645 [Dichotomocladium elegans]|nr:hypothetical protein BX666DRAFT_1997645 [Dichotomocladium elegans]